MFKDAKAVWRSNEEVREMIIRYYTDHKVLPEAADGNWRILPEAAAKELHREVEADARRTQNQ